MVLFIEGDYIGEVYLYEISNTGMLGYSSETLLPFLKFYV